MLLSLSLSSSLLIPFFSLFFFLSLCGYIVVIFLCLSLMAHADWTECFILRRVTLPSGFYFGATAATGDLADNHDIISFKV